jgi:starvation-inducible DNA-binding protein
MTEQKIISNPLIISLNTLFSNLVEQYFLYKHYHWHIKGQDFYNFHLLFDKHAEIIYESWDKIAERIRQKNGRVDSLLTEIQHQKSLSDYNPATKLNTQIQDYILPTLIGAHTVILAQMKLIVNESNSNSDVSTADLVTTLLEDQQQMMWFLESSLD